MAADSYHSRVSKTHSGISYRPDIDGLRAIAVLTVVIYHAELALPGGFVGVDVFFVISGFLITRIIVTGQESGSFSLVEFYERRARRLLPPLFAMMACVTVAAAIELQWFDLSSYGQEMAAASLYVSNIFFYFETNYFTETAKYKLLLHTWSLGVEEQFYLLAPPLLALLTRATSRKFVIGLLVLGTAVSLALSAAFTQSHAAAGFYLLPLRAWELAGGGVLALAAIRKPNARWFAEALTAIGLGAIAYACLFFDKSTPMPGWHATIPAAGGLALLYAGDARSLAHRVLAAGPVVYVGRISYGIYLWHWPLLVLANYRFPAMTIIPSCLALATTFIASSISYHWLEMPIRRGEWLRSRRAVFAAAGIGSAAFVALGLGLWASDGLPQRHGDSTHLSRMIQSGANARDLTCFDLMPAAFSTDTFCTQGMPGTRPLFVLVGDSHALALRSAVFAAARDLGISGIEVSGSGYVPAPGRWTLGEGADDDDGKAFVEWLRSRPDLKTVILTAFWSYQATGRTYRLEQTVMIDKDYDGSGMAYNPVALRHALDRLAASFPDRQFIILDDVPVGRALDSRLFVRNRGYERSLSDAAVSVAEARRQHALYDPILRGLAQSHANVRYLPFLTDAMCDDGQCQLFDSSGRPRYADGDHLNEIGAMPLVPRFRKILGPLAAPAIPAPQASSQLRLP